MKWVLIAVVLSLCAVFAPLYYVFGQDAPQQNPLILSQSIILNLQQLRQLNTQLMNESQTSKERSERAEALMMKQDQKLATSENLVKQLSMLVDDQMILYRKHLNRLRLYIGGLVGLIAVYNILKAFLRFKFKIKIW